MTARSTGAAILFFLGVFLVAGCAGPFEFRKTRWTVAEVQAWYQEYRDDFRSLQDGIIYQGSDDRYHHFIAHLQEVDNWAIIKISRDELEMEEEIPYRGVSGGMKTLIPWIR